MVEIYNYDIGPHERYARDQKEIEAFKSQYHIPTSRAGAIAVQTAILNLVPQHSATSLLFQTFQRKPWARFEIPSNFHAQRFLSSYVAPSLGNREKQMADVQRIKGFLKQQTRRVTRREEKNPQREGSSQEEPEKEEEEISSEGHVLIELIEKGVIETNEMVDFVIGRMHQFVQA